MTAGLTSTVTKSTGRNNGSPWGADLWGSFLWGGWVTYSSGVASSLARGLVSQGRKKGL